MNPLYTLWASLNYQSAGLLAVGLMAVTAWNWWQWRCDRALALRLRPPASSPPSSSAYQLPSPSVPLPKVSVLVAAWNEAEMIEQHIQSFLGLQYPDKELVLCAGGPDVTYEIARRYAGEQVIVLEQQPGEGKQRALQRCLEHASGAILFLTDADSLLDDGSFAQTLTPLLHEREDVATGTSRPLRSQLDNPFVIYQWCTDSFVSAKQPKFISGIEGRNWAVKRSALDEIGGFPGEVQTGTDYYMAKLLLHAGHRIRYVRESAIATEYPATFRSLWRCQSRWVRNLLLHGPKFGAYNEAWQALRATLAGWTMLLLPFLGLVVGPIFLALWAVLLAHALLARVRYARFTSLYQGVAIGWKQYGLLPLYMFVDFVAWSLPLLHLLTRRHQW
nr:glycosyltransferase [Chloroflexota bacterium]